MYAMVLTAPGVPAAFPLRQANDVLAKLRAGQIAGAAVLQP